MTRDEAVNFLIPRWQVVRESRDGSAQELQLHTGQVVEVYDDGTFHVSGKGWKSINRHLQESQWPPHAAIRTAEIREHLSRLENAPKKYFTEGLNCVQFAHSPRAAVVLGWTGFMDVLHHRLASDLRSVNAALEKKFPKLHGRGELKNIDAIRSLEDWQTVDLGHEMGLYKKHTHTQLQAMRDLRNNCAHVEEFAVTRDMALGFYSSLATYLEFLL
jgi:hypothetical protein